MKPTLHRLLDEIRSRKLRRALAIYVGVALPLVGIANMLENRYALPHIWFDRLLIVLAFGFVSTLVVAWYHGKEKVQRFRRRELIIHGVLFVAAAACVVFVPGRESQIRPLRTAAGKSIAVLPFQNFSDEKSDEFFSDGVTEDILAQLSKVADLRVISRTTMMQYKGTAKPIGVIGRELNVATVLEGSVRRSGTRVRIVGQLIDVSTDEHLWAESYDREIQDIFAIQSEVAQQIARALAAVLSPQEQERIATAPTASIDAYALYLRGRHHYVHYTAGENEKAIAFFTQAIALDTTYALAFAGLSDAYSQRVQRYGYTEDWLDSAAAAARRAIELNPEAAEGYKALGLAYDNRGMAPLALEQYERSVALNPNFDIAIRNIGLLYYRTGQLDRSLEAALKSVALAPDNVMGYVQVGMTLKVLAADSGAEAWYRKARQLDAENPFPLLGMGELVLIGGDAKRARSYVDTLLRLAPTLPPGLDLLSSLEALSGNYRAAFAAYEQSMSGPRGEGAFLLMKLGRKGEARRTAEDAVERFRRSLERGDMGPTPRWELAAAFSVLGNSDSTALWLQRAVDAGWRDYRLMLRDPLLADLQTDERFVSLVARVKASVDSMRTASLRLLD